jgi:hypothetical protein
MRLLFVEIYKGGSYNATTLCRDPQRWRLQCGYSLSRSTKVAATMLLLFVEIHKAAAMWLLFVEIHKAATMWLLFFEIHKGDL